MRVLITNNSLAPRGGIETFVRQLARGLQSRGHSVMAYSSDLRQGERLLESDVVRLTLSRGDAHPANEGEQIKKGRSQSRLCA